MTRRLLIVTGATSFVSPSSYGAALDVRGAYDAAVAGGALSTVTSATAAFVAGDTGKTYYLASTSGAVTTGTLTYVSSTSCTMTAAAGGAMTGARLIFGTDDTAAWQAALNAALPGQTVMCDDASFRSLCTGQLNVPNGVRLGSVGVGPFDPQTNPAMNTWGPTFVVGQSASAAFITLTTGAGLGDFIFYSANQVPPTAATATAFAPFVTMTDGSVAGCRIGSPYFANAYIGIAVQGGRHMIDRPQIGALLTGLSIDQSADVVDVRTLTCHPFWRICEGQTYTPTASSLDDFALSNAYALRILRSDAFHVLELFSFGLYGGLFADDSPDTGLTQRAGYGMVGMADLDLVAYGIAAKSTGGAGAGIIVSAAMIAANGTGVGTAGQAGVITQAGGTHAPTVVVGHWTHRGSWASGASVNGAGSLIVPGTNPG